MGGGGGRRHVRPCGFRGRQRDTSGRVDEKPNHEQTPPSTETTARQKPGDVVVENSVKAAIATGLRGGRRRSCGAETGRCTPRGQRGGRRPETRDAVRVRKSGPRHRPRERIGRSVILARGSERGDRPADRDGTRKSVVVENVTFTRRADIADDRARLFLFSTAQLRALLYLQRYLLATHGCFGVSEKRLERRPERARVERIERARATAIRIRNWWQ